jgi:hypothetical protein
MCNQENRKRVGIHSLRVGPLIPTDCRNGFPDKSDHQKITLQNATEVQHISRAARTTGELSATAQLSADSAYAPRTQAGRFSSQCPLRPPHSSQLPLTYQS